MKAKLLTIRFLLVITSVIMLISCEEELKPGCTNPDSVNYNSEANMDDGTCQYPRDIFIGAYTGTSLCTPVYPFGSDDFQFSITKNSDDPNIVDVRFSKLYGVEWTATVDKSTLVFNYSITRENPLICNVEHTTKGTMTLKATATLYEGNRLLSFSDFTYTVFDEMGIMVCRHSCTIDATKN